MASKKPATRDLLNDDNVRRWYQNTSRGSKLNADIRLRRLNLFCCRINTTPSALVRIGKRDVMEIENGFLEIIIKTKEIRHILWQLQASICTTTALFLSWTQKLAASHDYPNDLVGLQRGEILMISRKPLIHDNCCPSVRIIQQYGC